MSPKVPSSPSPGRPGAAPSLQHGTRALSLVELLVTVAVIASLLALLLPALGKVRERSGNARCIANLRQIAQAFRLYVEDHNGFGPPHWGEAFFEPPGNGNTWLWTGHIAPYLGSADQAVAKARLSSVFDCPSDPDSRIRPQWRGYASTADNWLISYGYNYPYLTSQRNWWRHAIDGLPRLNTVTNTARLVIVTDSVPSSKGGTLIALIDPASAATSNPKAGPDFRHGQRANVAFLDGHVESLDKSTLAEQEYWRPMR